MTSVRLRLALDQNFPTPLMRAVADYLPFDIALDHIADIDRRLSPLDDRALLIALRQLRYDGLVTNNYKMLYVPEEIAAIVKTKAVVVATRGLGHDPIRAVGALLLELPGLAGRLRPNASNVFMLGYEQRRPRNGWAYLQDAAARLEQTAEQLWQSVKVTDEEATRPVLT